MVIADLTPETIIKIINYQLYRLHIGEQDQDDCRQAAYLAVHQMISAIIKNDPERVLSRKHIVYTVRHAILREFTKWKGQQLTNDNEIEGKPEETSIEDVELINKLKKHLSQEQINLIELYYVQNLSLSQIAKILHISKSGVWERLQKVLNKMRGHFKEDEM